MSVVEAKVKCPFCEDLFDANIDMDRPIQTIPCPTCSWDIHVELIQLSDGGRQLVVFVDETQYEVLRQRKQKQNSDESRLDRSWYN